MARRCQGRGAAARLTCAIVAVLVYRHRHLGVLCEPLPVSQRAKAEHLQSDLAVVLIREHMAYSQSINLPIASIRHSRRYGGRICVSIFLAPQSELASAGVLEDVDRI